MAYQYSERKKAPLDYKSALQKAADFCAYQERSQQEVRDKLYSYGLHQDEVEEALSELIVQGFINEERFAKAYAGGKFRVKKWGRNKIVRELKMRDISSYCITKALEEIPEDDYESTLKALLAKKNKLIRDKNHYTRKAKLAKYAIGKGFESAMVWDLLRSTDYQE